MSTKKSQRFVVRLLVNRGRMAMSFCVDLIMFFAVAYLTYVCVATPGVLGVFDKLRDRFAHDSILGMFWCGWCFAFWASAMLHLMQLDWSTVGILSDAFLGGLLCWMIRFAQDGFAAWLELQRSVDV